MAGVILMSCQPFYCPPSFCALVVIFFGKESSFFDTFFVDFLIVFQKKPVKSCSSLKSSFEKLFDSCSVCHCYFLYPQTLCCVA